MKLDQETRKILEARNIDPKLLEKMDRTAAEPIIESAQMAYEADVFTRKIYEGRLHGRDYVANKEKSYQKKWPDGD